MHTHTCTCKHTCTHMHGEKKTYMNTSRHAHTHRDTHFAYRYIIMNKNAITHTSTRIKKPNVRERTHTHSSQHSSNIAH